MTQKEIRLRRRIIIKTKLTEQLKKNLSDRDIDLLERAIDVLEGNKYDIMNSYFGGKTMISPGAASTEK